MKDRSWMVLMVVTRFIGADAQIERTCDIAAARIVIGLVGEAPQVE
jgi:hypothetical protein